MTDQPEKKTAKDENEQITQRRAKLAALREQGIAYPNAFRRDSLAASLHEQYGELSGDELKEQGVKVRVAGRIMMRRIMGKASFAHVQDMSGRIQLYFARDHLPEGVYATFKTWDLGDIIGGSGTLFKTKTGELTVWLDQVELLTKALRPLPDKFHGLADQEQRYRQRYLDLLVNEDTKRIFEIRSGLLSGLRRFFDDNGYNEVETPMMHPLIGGAAARPFTTHHNAMNMELYMRIAPELYLKRLVVGGFEKVYEINRNFRNEGISTRHNPEFTMLEFYQAYADYYDLMDMTEALMQYLADQVLGTRTLNYQGETIDLNQPFKRMSIKQAIMKYAPGITEEMLDNEGSARKIGQEYRVDLPKSFGLGKIQMELFEAIAEHHIKQPTFITEFPTEVSPLSRVNDDNPFIVDRFELYVGGHELANGFSELNDPEDQAERFRQQLKAREAGEEETMSFDEDYIMALEHGLPPTAGEGIGIDRLVMLFADAASIREVILFPLLRQK